MKWNIGWLVKQPQGQFDFEETIVFPDEVFYNSSQINGLKDIKVSGHGRLDMSMKQLYVDLHIDGTMILPCAVSLENVDYPFTIDTLETFAFYKPEDEEDVIEVKKDTVDLTPVVYQEILLEVPMRVVKDGATMKQEGKGWKVLVEDEKDEDYIDPRLAKLKDYFKDKE